MSTWVWTPSTHIKARYRGAHLQYWPAEAGTMFTSTCSIMEWLGKIYPSQNLKYRTL